MNTLEAVNDILIHLQLPQVTTVDPPGSPVAAQAKAMLLSTSRSHQLNGWWFNRFLEVSRSPDVSNQILLPSNVTQVQAYRYTDAFAINEGYLYDVANDTDQFTDAVTLSEIRYLEWVACPPTYQEYVVAEAALQLHQNIRGNTGSSGTLMQRRDRAWGQLCSQDSRAVIRTVRNSTHHTRVVRQYRG